MSSRLYRTLAGLVVLASLVFASSALAASQQCDETAGPCVSVYSGFPPGNVYDWGGHIQTDPKIYEIRVGNWANNINWLTYLDGFYRALNGEPAGWARGLAHYHVNSITFEHSDSYTQVTQLGANEAAVLIAAELAKYHITNAANAQFDFLAAPNVTIPPPEESACGFHDYQTVDSLQVYYSVVPANQYTVRGPSSCTANYGNGAWNNPPYGVTVDALTSIASHEFAETATDPAGNPGWNTQSSGNGLEIGDLCSFYSYYDSGLGGLNVSWIWSNDHTACYPDAK